MNSPTYSGSPPYGHLLLLTAAALAAMSVGLRVSVPEDPFQRTFVRQDVEATPVQAAAPQYVEASDILPPPPHEVVGVSPGTDLTWVPGYYMWAAVRGGHHWVWFKGHYEHPPHPGAAWMAPHFEECGGGTVYVGGFWLAQPI